LFSLFVVVVSCCCCCCGEIDLCFVAPPNCRLSVHLKKEEQEELLKKMEALTEVKLGMGSVVMTGRKRGREDGGENVLQSEQQQQKGLLSQQSTKKKPLLLQQWVDPVQGMANVRHEFGEHGGVNMSIEASTTFTVLEPETMSKLFQGALGPDRDFYIYSRHFNPTVLNLSRQMAAMEGTEAAYCTSSGMSAISAILMQLCSSGDHIIASSRLYGGTHALLAHFLPRTCNITTTFVDIEDLGAVREALKKAPDSTTMVLYFESMSNPQLTVADIPALSGKQTPTVTKLPIIIPKAQLPPYIIMLFTSHDLHSCTSPLA
jgi:hypothetical protein